MKNGDHKQAIQFSQMAVRNKPHDGALHYHLGLAWKFYRNPEHALQAVDQALRIRPLTIPWMELRLELLIVLRREQEAVEEANRILGMPEGRQNLQALQTLDMAYAMQSDWEKLGRNIDALQLALQRPEAALNPTSIMMSIDDPKILTHVGRNSAQSYFKCTRQSRKWIGGKIILGYYSADFREHPVAYMMLDVLSRHDRELFEIVLIRLTPADDSVICRKIAALVDRELDISTASDLVSLRQIQDAGIDVIIDLTGLTRGHRADLLARRPCSTQILWLGCAVSTGCSHYDAFIVDSIVAPEGYDKFCSEPLVRLPCCYHPISCGLGDGASTLCREQLGIPSDVILIGILQQPNRIRAEFIEGIARVLTHHPHAHLMIRIKPSSVSQAGALLSAWGILPDRIHYVDRFEERSDYLQVIRLLDLAIDSYPYGGHSTTGEAISLGTPVLTCAGKTIHSRVAASMMYDFGLIDLVTNSPQEQCDMLQKLLSQPGLLATWKRRFQEAAALPTDMRHNRLVRELENAYVMALESASPAILELPECT